MNKELAKVLRQRIIDNGGLVFAEKLFGMVQTGERSELNDAGAQVRKRFPIATDVVVDGVCQSHETIVVPDSSLKGILYFEDNGSFPDGRARSGSLYQFTSNL